MADALHSFSATADIPKAIDRARFLRAECDARGVQILVASAPSYPRRLLALEDAPNPLYVLGDATLLERPRTVALVGSRKSTSGGRHAAYRFAAALSAAHVCVVSGLAAGIDSESHTGALSSPGSTIAVLGTGIDVPYPAANAPLHAAIARQGLVISEHPPGTTAFPGSFPRRNRIIAALADVVVVVEAGLKSGALITAQLADALGRPVAAVPGSIENPQSAGSNQLLRDGAHVVTSPDDVLAMLSLVSRKTQANDSRNTVDIAVAHAIVESESSEPRVAPASSRTGSRLARTSRQSSALRRPREEADVARTAELRAARTSSSLADALAAGQQAGVAESALGDAETAEQRILSVLSSGPQFSDDLIRAARAGAREVTSALSLLTLAGLVVTDSSGLVRRR